VGGNLRKMMDFNSDTESGNGDGRTRVRGRLFQVVVV